MPEADDTLVARVHREILDGGGRVDPGDLPRLRRLIERAAPLSTERQIAAGAEQLGRRLFGLGALEALLADDDIDEVMVNGPGRVWIERRGRLERTDVAVDEATVRVTIERIVGPLGLRVDRTVPFVDARLPDGSRVHIAVPPLALDGPYVTIRRFAARGFALDDFCEPPVTRLLSQAVRSRASLVISGGTGSGKTSLLNALAAHIPPNERVVTVEDAAELRLPGRHVIRLEARPANAEGVGEVTVRTLVRNALRMRPDRIIVGEVRGAEALDMVQAMNTGHEGSMSTCHANSPIDALHRLETMIMMSDVDLPVEIVREHLQSTVDLVVQVARGEGAGRRVVAVTALDGPCRRALVVDGRLAAGGDAWLAKAAT